MNMDIHPPTEVLVWSPSCEQLLDNSSRCSSPDDSSVNASSLSSASNSPARSRLMHEDSDDDDDECDNVRHARLVTNESFQATRTCLKRADEMNVLSRESRKSRIRASRSSWFQTDLDEKPLSLPTEVNTINDINASPVERRGSPLVEVGSRNIVSPQSPSREKRPGLSALSYQSATHLPAGKGFESERSNKAANVVSDDDDSLVCIRTLRSGKDDPRRCESESLFIHAPADEQRWCMARDMSSRQCEADQSLVSERRNSDNRQYESHTSFEHDSKSVSEQLSLLKSSSRSDDRNCEVNSGIQDDSSFTGYIPGLESTSGSSWQSPQRSPHDHSVSMDAEEPHIPPVREYGNLFYRRIDDEEGILDSTLIRQQLDPSLDEELRNISIIEYQGDELGHQEVRQPSSDGSDVGSNNLSSSRHIDLSSCQDDNEEHEMLLRKWPRDRGDRYDLSCMDRGVVGAEHWKQRSINPVIDTTHDIEGNRQLGLRIANESSRNRQILNNRSESAVCSKPCRSPDLLHDELSIDLTCTTSKTITSDRLSRDASSIPEADINRRNFNTSSSIDGHLDCFLDNDSEFNSRRHRLNVTQTSDKADGDSTGNSYLSEPTIAFILNETDFNLSAASFPNHDPCDNAARKQLEHHGISDCRACRNTEPNSMERYASNKIDMIPPIIRTESLERSFVDENCSGSESEKDEAPLLGDQRGRVFREERECDYYQGTVFDSRNNHDGGDEEDFECFTVGSATLPEQRKTDGKIFSTSDEIPLIRSLSDCHYGTNGRSHSLLRRNNIVGQCKKWSTASNATDGDSLSRRKGYAVMQQKRWQKPFHRRKDKHHHKQFSKTTDLSQDIDHFMYPTLEADGAPELVGVVVANSDGFHQFSQLGIKATRSFPPTRLPCESVSSESDCHLEKPWGESVTTNNISHSRRGSSRSVPEASTNAGFFESELIGDLCNTSFPPYFRSSHKQVAARRNQQPLSSTGPVGGDSPLGHHVGGGFRSDFAEQDNELLERSTKHRGSMEPAPPKGLDYYVSAASESLNEPFPGPTDPPQLRRLSANFYHGRDFELGSSDLENRGTLADPTAPMSEYPGKLELPNICYTQISVSKEMSPAVYEVVESASPLSDFIALRIDSQSQSSVTVDNLQTRDAEVKNTTEGLLSELDDMMKDLDETLEECDSSSIKEEVTDIHVSNALTQADVSGIDMQTPDKHSESKSGVAEIQNDACGNDVPLLVITIDNDIGIPKGDMTISLLNSHGSNGADKVHDKSIWANRINEAIWRCRTLRRHDVADRKDPQSGRSSVIVDVDDVRVLGGVESIGATQAAVLDHLKCDDFGDALVMYESILDIYNNFAIENECTEESMYQHKAYISTALHNVGVIHMLGGNYKEAFTFFERATMIRASSLGVRHPDHIASLVKMATCLFALEDFPNAHSSLEVAASLAKDSCSSLVDHCQLGEVLNNLGCLCFMCGEMVTASQLFSDSIGVFSAAADNSLYVGSKYSCHAVSLNISIVRGNIGLLALGSGNLSNSVQEFESAAKCQITLLRDAHPTLMATMDHLVVANVTAGRNDRGLQLLRRILHMQIDVFGSTDKNCKITSRKIYLLEQQSSNAGRSVKDDNSTSNDIDGGVRCNPLSENLDDNAHKQVEM